MSAQLPYSIQALGRLSPGVRREVSIALSLARRFNEEVLRPHALEIDRRIEADPDYVSEELLGRFCEFGFFSQWIPKYLGGKGFAPFSMMPFNEELGSECLGAANILGAHSVALSLLSATLNTRLLKRIAREIIQGELHQKPCILSVAITESSAGSDLEEVELLKHAKVRCLAKKVEGGYRMSGSKIFISNARIAGYHIVVAYTDLKFPALSPVVLAVRAGSQGLSLGRPERKMGQHASAACELIFEDCFVSDEFVALAPEQYRNPGDYTAHAALLVNDVLPMSRAGVGALATGAARSAFEKAIHHAKREKLDGTPLSDHQWIQEKLSLMQKNVALSRLLYWEATFAFALEGPYRDVYGPVRFLSLLPRFVLERLFSVLLNSKRTVDQLRRARIREAETPKSSEISALGSLTKFASSDLAIENCRIAVEIMGSAGLRQSQGVEKILRDTVLLQIFEGTNELNRITALKDFCAREHSEIRFFE